MKRKKSQSAVRGKFVRLAYLQIQYWMTTVHRKRFKMSGFSY